MEKNSRDGTGRSKLVSGRGEKDGNGEIGMEEIC